MPSLDPYVLPQYDQHILRNFIYTVCCADWPSFLGPAGFTVIVCSSSYYLSPCYCSYNFVYIYILCTLPFVCWECICTLVPFMEYCITNFRPLQAFRLADFPLALCCFIPLVL